MADETAPPWHGRMLYGGAIHASIATSDLAKMKEMKQEAEKWLAQYGSVSGALEVLKAEIAKKEKP